MVIWILHGGVHTVGPQGGCRSGSQAWMQQLPAAEHICCRSSSSMVGQARPQLPQLSGSERARHTGGVPHGSGSNPALQARPQVQPPLICEQVANPLAMPGHRCVPPQVCGFEKSVSQPSGSSSVVDRRQLPPVQFPHGNWQAYVHRPSMQLRGAAPSTFAPAAG